MSNILTVASVPGVFGGGYMDWGRLSREEIIKRTRAVATHEKEKWEAVLAASDEQFDVKVVQGVHTQKLLERL